MQTRSPFNFPGFTEGLSVSFWYLFTGTASDNWSRIIDFYTTAAVDNVIIAKAGTTNNLVASVRQGYNDRTITATGSWVVGMKAWNA